MNKKLKTVLIIVALSIITSTTTISVIKLNHKAPITTVANGATNCFYDKKTREIRKLEENDIQDITLRLKSCLKDAKEVAILLDKNYIDTIPEYNVKHYYKLEKPIVLLLDKGKSVMSIKEFVIPNKIDGINSESIIIKATDNQIKVFSSKDPF